MYLHKFLLQYEESGDVNQFVDCLISIFNTPEKMELLVDVRYELYYAHYEPTNHLHASTADQSSNQQTLSDLTRIFPLTK